MWTTSLRLYHGHKKGFTLVELIVVVVILAILGTIGFLSIQGFSSKSRDSNRAITLKQIQSWLEKYTIQSGYFPDPEGTVLSGSINGITYSNRGYIKGNITRLIGIDKIPLDPLVKTEYIYAVSSPDRLKYQIASTFENTMVTLWDFVVNTAHAESLQQARVNGNYLGYFKYMSGSSQYIINAPSLIFANTGSVDLTSTSTYYIVNNGSNLPLSNFNWANGVFQNPDQVLKTVTGRSDAVLMSVNIDNITLQNLTTYFSGATLSSFWWKMESVQSMVFDTDTKTSTGTVLNCSAGTYINGNSCSACPANSWCAAGVTSPTACTGGTTSATGSTSISACITVAVSPTNLALSHSSNSRNFNVSWTAGSGNGGASGCKLQFQQNASTWTDITGATSLNCDANLSTGFSLTNGWKSGWGGTSVRVVRIGTLAVLGTFSQTLNCSGAGGSITSTSNTDEDCNGEWDNSYATDVNCSTPSYCGGNSYSFDNANADVGLPYSCPSSITYRGQTVGYTGLHCEVPLTTHLDASCSTYNAMTPSVRWFQSWLSGIISGVITSWPANFIGTSLGDSTCRTYGGSYYAKAPSYARWGWSCYCNYSATFYN